VGREERPFGGWERAASGGSQKENEMYIGRLSLTLYHKGIALELKKIQHKRECVPQGACGREGGSGRLVFTDSLRGRRNGLDTRTLSENTIQN